MKGNDVMVIIIELIIFAICSMLLGDFLGYFTDNIIPKMLLGEDDDMNKIVKVETLNKTIIIVNDERKKD